MAVTKELLVICCGVTLFFVGGVIGKSCAHDGVEQEALVDARRQQARILEREALLARQVAMVEVATREELDAMLAERLGESEQLRSEIERLRSAAPTTRAEVVIKASTAPAKPLAPERPQEPRSEGAEGIDQGCVVYVDDTLSVGTDLVLSVSQSGQETIVGAVRVYRNRADLIYAARVEQATARRSTESALSVVADLKNPWGVLALGGLELGGKVVGLGLVSPRAKFWGLELSGVGLGAWGTAFGPRIAVGVLVRH